MIAPLPRSTGELWIVGGPNGAGKTTFIERATADDGTLKGVPTPNLDRNTGQLLSEAGYADRTSIPAEVYWHFFKRADEALQAEIRGYLDAKKIVCVETVLSTDKYFSVVEYAKERQIPFRLVYVFIRSPALALARVAQRVGKGGHPVPSAKVTQRYYRSLHYLPLFAALADDFWVNDNSDSGTSSKDAVIEGSAGTVAAISEDCPITLAQRFTHLMPR